MLKRLTVIVIASIALGAAIPLYRGTSGPVPVIGGAVAANRPANQLRLNFPEAAIELSGGRVLIANAGGFTAELVEGDTVRTILADRGNARPSMYGDLVVADDGAVIALDVTAPEVLFLDPDTLEVAHSLPGPVEQPGEFTFLSSVDEQGGRILVAGAQVSAVGQSQYIQADSGGLYEWDGQGWIAGIRAGSIASGAEKFRDARYTEDGDIIAVIGTLLVLIDAETQEVIRSLDLGADHGGGFIERPDGWLVGSFTRLVSVPHDFSRYDIVPISLPFANAGHLSEALNGDILLTDTDRQTVYRLNLAAENPVVSSYGNTQASDKIVALAAQGMNLLTLDNSTPLVSSYNTWFGIRGPIAGTGKQGYDSPRPANEYSFQYPSGMAVGPDGAIYVSEANYRIARVLRGKVDIFAGDIQSGVPVEGADRTKTFFGGLRGLSVGPNGDLYVTDQGNHSIWRIDAAGLVHKVMGTGSIGTPEAGQPAVEQALNWPSGVLARKDGSVLVADSYNHAVWSVRPDGVVECFAGSPSHTVYQGYGGYAGDGGPACEAKLNTPRGMTEDGAGNVYIVDEFNNAIRKVGPEGIISTFAGGKLGFAADGSRFNLPVAATVMGGKLYVADVGNGTVWSFPLDYKLSTEN